MWCLRGLLPKQQEETLEQLFTAIDLITQEEYQTSDLQDLIETTSQAVALMERDFPLALQVSLIDPSHMSY